jgi:hypothetical protein
MGVARHARVVANATDPFDTPKRVIVRGDKRGTGQIRGKSERRRDWNGHRGSVRNPTFDRNPIFDLSLDLSPSLRHLAQHDDAGFSFFDGKEPWLKGLRELGRNSPAPFRNATFREPSFHTINAKEAIQNDEMYLKSCSEKRL